MRKSLLAALIAATAMVPPVALAQDRDGRGNRGGMSERSGGNRSDGGRQNWQRSEGQRQAQPQRQNWQQRSESQARPQRQEGQARVAQAQRPQAQPQQNRPAERYERQDNNRGGLVGATQQRVERQQRDQRWRDNDRRDDRNRWDNNRRPDRNWNGNRGGQWNDNRGNYNRWNNSWRSDRRYNWSGYRSTNRSIFRLPRYYAPSGYSYGYRRFGIGFTLSSVLFAQNYWINDPFHYRLPEVYGPYRWVRYYNDALLVDTYTGEVVDAIYDIFW